MPARLPQVTIPNTEVRMLPSSHVAQEFKLFVGLPFHYFDSESTYPTLYVLDANGGFGAVTDTVRLLSLDGGELPELIVIGIGYPVETFPETLRQRARDFSPTRNPKAPEDAGFGGAGDFLRFIREELFPLVDASFRTTTRDRAVLGVSFGGLFALYALFQKPDTFGRYVIASPSFGYDDGVIFTHERDYASSHVDLPAKVYMSMGGLEGERPIAHLRRMEQSLRRRGYPSLDLTTHILPGETHRSEFPAAMCRGLRTVFGKA